MPLLTAAVDYPRVYWVRLGVEYPAPSLHQAPPVGGVDDPGRLSVVVEEVAFVKEQVEVLGGLELYSYEKERECCGGEDMPPQGRTTPFGPRVRGR